ncbi:nitroreductase family deazaflavin-dependent oxidoreductase [Nocardia sp. NBC_01503]|uniref:nitroreductase family deazaflavin-dependent oxidoreductase n=1 Tax=Nocardia sp. NBC_01503 TaxID=2975997 RepID=UPI002E7B891C|nr:nitroreductase family deazaflavin-dependent oxidoreductase [Nocardia sp. NBC_01503]WTL31146.1 nitroreductase family deazaflavin-dependent oxidoreductase [Nocardia sp. NBC_01503]
MTDVVRQQMNQDVIEEFRANGGTVGGQFEGHELLLLTTTGAHTGEPRTWPLGFHRDGDNLVVFAANGGRPNRPGWYYNLLAHPDAVIEVGTDTWPVRAEVTNGAERQRLWTRVLEPFPFLADFQAKVSWEIPVITLSRTEN